MVQLQGHGAVSEHHSVADGALVSNQDFAEWHTDGVHDTPMSTNPPAVTTMYCLDTPLYGGETLFASSRAGFAALPAELKIRARRLSAVLDGRFRTMNRAGTRALPSEVAVTEQDEVRLTNRWPLVIVDESLSEALYSVAPAFTRFLIETNGESGEEVALSPEDSQQLLEAILTAALMLPSPSNGIGNGSATSASERGSVKTRWDPPSDGRKPIAETSNVIAHTWAIGDLVVWSNRSTLHSASPSPRYTHNSSDAASAAAAGGSGHRRLFHRVRMASRLPVRQASAAGSWSVPPRLLAVYCRLWSVQQLLLCGAMATLVRACSAAVAASAASTAGSASGASSSETNALAPPTSILLAPLLVLLAARPSLLLLALSHACVLSVNFSKLPFVWDFLVWDFQTDAVTLLAVLTVVARATMRDETGLPPRLLLARLWARTRSSTSTASAELGEMAMAVAAPIVRAQYCIFYALTAVWKLNSTFLDTSRSCAPIFFLQLLDTYLPSSLTPPWLPRLCVLLAPSMTIAVEGAIPALLCRPGNSRKSGLCLGLLLHLLIALTPPPNNAGAFSVTILVRYFFFAPHAVATAAHNTRALSLSVAVAVMGMASHTEDLAVGISLGLATLHAHALLRSSRDDDDASPTSTSSQSLLPPPRPVVPMASVRWLRMLAVGVATLYSFGLPVLGLQDMMAPTMFANLRVFSGSNHYLLPTGLLLSTATVDDDASSLSRAALFPTLSGGVVWVESTTSPTINGVYPAEVTTQLTPNVQRHLLSNGHSGRIFAPYLARVIGAGAVAPPPSAPPSLASAGREGDDSSGGEAWMVPMVELRRLLTEARAAGESFMLTYRRQRSDSDLWQRVRVEQGPPGGTPLRCTVLASITWLPLLLHYPARACSEEERELLATAPPRWAMRWLLFFPFPMRLSDATRAATPELGCLA